MDERVKEGDHCRSGTRGNFHKDNPRHIMPRVFAVNRNAIRESFGVINHNKVYAVTMHNLAMKRVFALDTDSWTPASGRGSRLRMNILEMQLCFIEDRRVGTTNTFFERLRRYERGPGKMARNAFLHVHVKLCWQWIQDRRARGRMSALFS